MSRLVGVWERSYRLDDDELAALAALQSQLAAPFLGPAPEGGWEGGADGGVRGGFWGWCHAQQAAAAAAEPPPRGALEAVQSIERHRQALDGLGQSLGRLGGLAGGLGEAHTRVKSKSVVMKSLWEGLLTQQRQFEGFADMIEARLAVFTGFDGLQAALLAAAKTGTAASLAARDFQGAYRKALQNAAVLAAKPECSREAPLYLWRYRQLLSACLLALRTLLEQQLVDIHMAGKQCGSPLAASQEAGLGARWEAVVAELGPIAALVKETANAQLDDDSSGEFGQCLHGCLSKYLATRYELFTRRTKHLAPAGVGELAAAAGPVVRLLQEERCLFDRLFGLTPDLYRHFDYFCQQALLPVVAVFREAIAALSPPEGQQMRLALEHESAALAERLPEYMAYEERFLDILKEYCGRLTK